MSVTAIVPSFCGTVDGRLLALLLDLRQSLHVAKSQENHVDAKLWTDSSGISHDGAC